MSQWPSKFHGHNQMASREGREKRWGEEEGVGGKGLTPVPPRPSGVRHCIAHIV